jgi:hypothetical protein
MQPKNTNLLRASAELSKEFAQKAITDFRRYVVGQGLLKRTQEQEERDWAQWAENKESEEGSYRRR